MFINVDQYHKERIVRKLQTLAMLVLLAALPCVLAYMFIGEVGALFVFVLVLSIGLFLPSVSSDLVMHAMNARRLNKKSLPNIQRAVELLSREAQLENTPQLYLIPTSGFNALATGNSHSSAIAISTGLLNLLSFEEICGVIGHELGHIKNNDTGIIKAAEWTSLLASNLLFILIIVTFLMLPWLVMSADINTFVFMGLLYACLFTPMLTRVLVSALSRAREYDADLFSAKITGNPAYLASALLKLERVQQGAIFNFFRPQKNEAASWLSSHPATYDRVSRLKAVSYEPTRNILSEISWSYPRHVMASSKFLRGLGF